MQQLKDMKSDWIRAYIKQSLPVQESNIFEQELENDLLLKEVMEGLETYLSENKYASLEALEKDIHGRIDNIKISQTFNKHYFSLQKIKFSTAACILGFCSFIACHLSAKKNKLVTQELYAEYFKPLTHPDGIVRGGNINNEENAAIKAYEEEDYFAAVRHYEKLVHKDSGNVKYNLFLGISLLATQQQKKAIVVLNRITKSLSFCFDIQWYLALAYIKNQELENAKNILSNLTKQENYYQYGAMIVMEKLNSLSESGSQ